MKPCVFCDEWGSAAREEAFDLELMDQVAQFKSVIQKRFRARKFLAYFQAYTNTFLKLKTLQTHLQSVLSDPEIQGVVLGTRPDCISKAVLDLWQDLAKTTYVGVELGVQSFYDEPLRFLERGHSGQDSIAALEKIEKETGLRAGIHLIFGIPGETDEQILQTARLCNQLPVHNVKLHHLHVLKNTPLADMYMRGEFTPIEFSDYARKVGLFLSELSPSIYVQRLAAYSPRWDELLAPQWTNDKMKTHQELIDHLHAHHVRQGLNFKIL